MITERGNKTDWLVCEEFIVQKQAQYIAQQDQTLF